MNRIVLFGVATFFALVGIELIGGPKPAKAGYGWLFNGGHGCHGWHQCYGASRCYGCNGCWGCQGCYGPVAVTRCHGCYGCHGCSGCWGCYGCQGCWGMVPVEITPALPPEPAPPLPAPAAQTPPETKSTGVTPTPAELFVRLPADARLIVDDFVEQSTGSQRHYCSPSLEAGKSYAYELRAEVIRDGRNVGQTKRVQVKAGETVNVEFELDAPQVAWTANK